MKGTGKGGKTNKGETRKIFTKDEPTNVDVSAKGGGDGAGAGDGGAAAEADTDADAAAQVGRQAGSNSPGHLTRHLELELEFGACDCDYFGLEKKLLVVCVG